MALDINRLHDVVEQIFNNTDITRYAGKTTAMVYLMLGNVWVGETPGKFLYVGHNAVTCDIAKAMFISALKKDGYKLEITQQEVIVDGTQIFYFRTGSRLSARDFELFRTGLHNMFIDINWDDIDITGYRVLYNTLREFEDVVVKHEFS
jgi:hypothetical protein